MAGQSETQNFDAIIIGSGIAGLTAGAVLAKYAGKRVLILERHYVIGGFTHMFRRPGGREWDVGVHYIGEMHKGSFSRGIFDYISDGQLKWQRMNDPFERFVYPGGAFDVYGDPARYQADLIERFPAEENAILTYFQDIRTASSLIRRRGLIDVLPAIPRAIAGWFPGKAGKFAAMTTGEYLDRHFSDPMLKALLASQWGDYGLPPGESSFAVHATVVRHYLKGGYYPIGGARQIAETAQPVIERAGGQCLINHTVKEILVDERGRACGVVADRHGRAGKGEIRYRAPLVISTVGAHNTYQKLLGEKYRAGRDQAAAQLKPSRSMVILFLSFRESPASLGFKGENHWIYGDLDHDRMAADKGVMEGKPNSVALFFPSLKDPAAEVHTGQIIAFADYEDFKPWADRRWKKRGADYDAMKQRIADGLIDFVESRYQGLKGLIDYAELATPLSLEHFSGMPNGAVYGAGATPKRFANAAIGHRTPVKNLYLAGADGLMFGVTAALMSGVVAASLDLGKSALPKLMTAIMTEHHKVHARED